MKTVLALIEHPNLDRILVPVVIKLQERGVHVKAHCLASWFLSVLLDHMKIDIDVRQHINSYMQEQFYQAENREPAYRYIYTVTLSGCSS